MTPKRLIATVIILVTATTIVTADLESECKARFDTSFDTYEVSTPETGDSYEQTNVEILASFTKPVKASSTGATLVGPTTPSIETEKTPGDGYNAEYTFTPSRSRLTDGTYYLSVSGNDSEITRRSCVKFTVDTPQMNIWVDSPNPTGLDQPDFAFVEDNPIDLDLETQRPGVCRIQLNYQGDLSNLTRAYNQFGPPTQITDEATTIHSTDVNLQNETESWDVICREENNPGQSQTDRYAYERLTFGLDDTPPSLNMNISPVRPIDYRPTTMTVSAVDGDDKKPEQVVCEISDTTNLLTDYNPTPWRNTTSEDYQSRHAINATAPTAGETTVEAVCTDRAGQQSTVTGMFEAAYDASETIVFEEPSNSVTNNRDLPVTLSTQSSQVTCSVSVDDNTADLTGQGFEDGRYVHNGTVTLPDEETEHTIQARCLYKEERATTANTTVTLDTTPPKTPGLTVNDASCTPRQVSFDIDHPAEPPVTLEYEVANNTDDSQVYSSASRQTNDWSVTATTSSLPVNHTVRITAQAVDAAGNNQTASAQTTIRNQGATACDTTPPSISLTKTNQTTDNAIVYDVTCSDTQTSCTKTYDYSMASNPASCTYDQQNNQNTSISVQQNGYLCVAVYDQNSNNATATRTVSLDSPDHCYDNEINVDETGVDCGGPQSSCSLCGEGQQCDTNKDCYLTLTCQDGTCQQPLDHCSNNVQDDGETGVDCGGPDCAPCQTKQYCSNGVQDRDETGVDCGGPNCAPCNNGTEPPENSTITCSADEDCASNNCVDGVCQAPTCSDGVKNQFETAVDCGGPNCEACEAEAGKACSDGSDCPGPEFACQTVQGTQQCVETPASCSNGEQNGAETGVDCGGPACQGCSIGGQCQSNQDCQSGLCKNNTCKAPSCSDGVKNQGEGDVDCGQVCTTEKLCDIGDTCDTGADCTSKNCNDDTGICEAASCTNDKQDGDETDVDCGGATCVDQGYTCSNDERCERDADCATGFCADDGTCKLPPNQDSDNDGLPDRWENKHGSSKTSMEPLEDPDEDSFTNLEEYNAGTDPNDSASKPSRPENNTPAYILLATGLLFSLGGGGLIYYDEQLRSEPDTDFSLDDQQPTPTPDTSFSDPSQEEAPLEPDQESNTMKELEKERDELLDAFEEDTEDDDINFTTSSDDFETTGVEQPDRPEHHDDEYIQTGTDKDSTESDDETSDKASDIFDELDDMT